MNAKNLINWGELSRLLSGDRGNVRRNRIPAKYQNDVNRLIKLVGEWGEEVSRKTSKPIT